MTTDPDRRDDPSGSLPSTGLRAAIRERPWLLVVALLGLFVLSNLVFLTIALSNPPQLISRAAAPVESGR